MGSLRWGWYQTTHFFLWVSPILYLIPHSFRGKKMRRFNSHKTVVVFSSARCEKYRLCDFVPNEIPWWALILPLLRWCLPPFKDMKGITSAPKTLIVQVFDRKLNVLMYQLVLSKVNILLELQWWKTSVLAGITLQLELHKLRRPTQDDNETTVVSKNDTMFYFVLAFCQEGGYLFDSYIPVRSCLSIAASVPWSLFLFRILLIGHCFWNIPIRNLRSVLFFFQRIFDAMISYALGKDRKGAGRGLEQEVMWPPCNPATPTHHMVTWFG